MKQATKEGIQKLMDSDEFKQMAKEKGVSVEKLKQQHWNLYGKDSAQTTPRKHSSRSSIARAAKPKVDLNMTNPFMRSPEKMTLKQSPAKFSSPSSKQSFTPLKELFANNKRSPTPATAHRTPGN